MENFESSMPKTCSGCGSKCIQLARSASNVFATSEKAISGKISHKYKTFASRHADLLPGSKVEPASESRVATTTSLDLIATNTRMAQTGGTDVESLDDIY